MLSVECQSVYDALCDITGKSEVYKIVEADEITEKIPPALSFTKVQLSQIIRDLKDREYLDVKYFTPDEYCLRVIKRIVPEPSRGTPETPTAEDAEQMPAEQQPTKQRELYGEKNGKAKNEKGGVRHGLVFFMSFLGGLFGSGIVAAITAVLVKFVL